MALSQSLTIDIARRGTIHIPAKQADHGYDIIITVLENGVNIVDHTTDTASYRVQKPDGNAVYDSCTVNNDDTITFHIDDDGQILAVAGFVSVDISIEENGDVKSTQNFVLDVQAAPGGSQIPSSTEFTQLQALVTSVNQLNEDAEAYAIGERGGVPVTSGDPAYENNAKYYAGQMGGLKSDFTNYKGVDIPPQRTSFFTGTTNLFNPLDADITTDGYYDRSNQFVSDPVSRSRTTGYISVLPNHNYASSVFSEASGFVLFYTSDKEFLSNIDYSQGTAYITAPDNAYYAKFPFLRTSVETVIINEGTSPETYVAYNALIGKEYIPNPSCVEEASANLYDASSPDILAGYYDRTNTFVSSSSLRSTGYIPVKLYHSYSFTHNYNGYALWYDSEKSFLGYTDFSSSLVYVTATLTDVAYMRLLHLASETASYMVNEGTTLSSYVAYKREMLKDEYMPNDYCGLFGVAFGTSLTYRAQTTGGYLQYLPSLSGIAFDNQGVGSSVILANGNQPSMLPTITGYSSFAGKNVCILEGFVNDWYYNGGSLGTWTDTGTTTVCGCVRTALTHILTQNANITVFLVLDPYGKGITASNAVNGAGDTQFEFYEEIAKVAESMGVIVIKEYAISGISELTPQYLLDNIHPNALGAEHSARVIWSQMRQYYPNLTA